MFETPVDYNGIAVVIGALGAFIVSIINAILNWRDKNARKNDKQEAIQAREQQNVKLSTIAQGVDGLKEKVVGGQATDEHPVSGPPAPVVTDKEHHVEGEITITPQQER